MQPSLQREFPLRKQLRGGLPVVRFERGKEASQKGGGVICLLRSLKTQKGTKHTKNTLNPVVAYLAGCVSKNKKAQKAIEIEEGNVKIITNGLFK